MNFTLIEALLSSDWFAIIAITWAIIAFANKDKRGELLSVFFDLLTKPIIFYSDPNAKSVGPYARELLETLARVMTSGIFDVTQKTIAIGKEWNARLSEKFSDDDASFWKMLGSVILFLLMMAFFYADLIAIFSTLNEIGLGSTPPKIFSNYEHAITIGSFFTIVLAGFLLIEISGTSIFTEFANQPKVARGLLTLVSVVLVFSGLAVAISLGLVRRDALIGVSNLANDASYLGGFNNLIITVLVPANSILSTFVIASEGAKGIPIVSLLLAQALGTIVVAMMFVFAVVNYAVWFVVDILYRSILMGVYLVTYYVFTPLDAMTSWKPFREEDSSM